MWKKLLALTTALCVFYASASAQVYCPAPSAGAPQGTAASPISVAPAPGSITSTNAVQTCGSMSAPVATLSSTVSVAALNCPGAGSYDVRIVPTSGAPLVGTITSTDSTLAAAPSGRRLYKNGVGPLEVTSDNLAATNTTPLTYRANGGDNLTITLSNYTSGSAAVYITASFTATMVLVNGSIDNREEAALRNGKAFTASTGLQTVTAGQYEALTLANPAGSGVRLVIPANSRIVACSNPSNAALPAFQSLPNVATNVPSTAATITRRGGLSGTSSATVTITASTASKPDTNPTTANPVGLPFFGAYAVPQDRTLEAGNTLTIMIGAVGTGLTAANNPTCSIIVSWFEESLN